MQILFRWCFKQSARYLYVCTVYLILRMFIKSRDVCGVSVYMYVCDNVCTRIVRFTVTISYSNTNKCMQFTQQVANGIQIFSQISATQLNIDDSVAINLFHFSCAHVVLQIFSNIYQIILQKSFKANKILFILNN